MGAYGDAFQPPAHLLDEGVINLDHSFFQSLNSFCYKKCSAEISSANVPSCQLNAG
jgi:hypothetical protein